MEYLDTNAELKRQVTTLQKYLMQVVEHSEMEVQDHEINERIWRKEKMQLKAQIKILKNGGTIEDMDDDDGNLLENFDVNNSSMAVSHSELESSIINLTSERDSLKETVHMLSAKLGIEPNVINNNNNTSNKKAWYNIWSNEEDRKRSLNGNDEQNKNDKVDQKKEIDVDQNNNKDEIIMQRIIDENTELNNKIELYDKQLEDAKIAVLKAAAVIKELNKDIDHERQQKEEYKSTCEELQMKLLNQKKS